MKGFYLHEGLLWSLPVGELRQLLPANLFIPHINSLMQQLQPDTRVAVEAGLEMGTSSWSRSCRPRGRGRLRGPRGHHQQPRRRRHGRRRPNLSLPTLLDSRNHGLGFVVGAADRRLYAAESRERRRGGKAEGEHDDGGRGAVPATRSKGTGGRDAEKEKWRGVFAKRH